ncbi:MAG: leucyl aminopeptidase [Burkholderiales bacterium]|nr:leucyl aminopeptidase [Burkholderiales bacterium]
MQAKTGVRVEFSTIADAPEKSRSDCIVVGVFEGNELSEPARLVDRASKGFLSGVLKHGDLEGRVGSSLLLHNVPGVAATRVLLVGLGKRAEFGSRAYRDAMRSAVRALTDSGATSAAAYLAQVPLADRDVRWALQQAAAVASDASYRFDQLKSKKPDRRGLKTLALQADDARNGAAAVGRGAAIGAGVSLAKDLGNLPSNICTPTYLARRAQELARRHKLECQVLDEREMEKLAMGALLAVTRGTREPAKLIVLHYRGAGRKDKPVALVGKGITFDTGGISIKPSAEMDEMKYDMSGAGSVLGTLEAVARMKLAVNVVGIIAACENMPGGNAVKPGDIVTSMSGQTIEILNTDAEGRLVLADALTYAERFEPAAVIDIATLTGACVIALGSVASGLYSNDEGLAHELLDAGQQSWDRAWQMPLWPDYDEQIKSPFADVANVGGRPAGSVTAACFLARFARKFRWAHLDIAGTAWRSGKDKGSTGRPVPLLTTFLMQRADAAAAPAPSRPAKRSAAKKTRKAGRKR